jgi:hypothetical protein
MSGWPGSLFRHGRYAWNNGDNAALLLARKIGWALTPSVTVVESHHEDSAPSFAYQGRYHRYCLDYLEIQRNPTGSSHRTIRRYHLVRPVAPVTADVDIHLVERVATAPAPAQGTFVDFPLRLHFMLDTSKGVAHAMKHVSRRERQNFARFRRAASWQWRESTDLREFLRFYREAYLPTMRQRHGEFGRVEPEDSAVDCVFRRGRFFVLSNEDGPVAGMACRWNGRRRRLTVRLLGVAGGETHRYSHGAMKLLYAYLIEWAADHGVETIDYQGAEAFLSKGTVQWKRRVSSMVVRAPNHFGCSTVRMYIRRDTDQVRDFLVANPLYTLDESGAFMPTYFFDDQRPARHDLPGTCGIVTNSRDIHLDRLLANTSRGPRPPEVGHERRSVLVSWWRVGR